MPARRTNTLQWRWLGRVPYGQALERQRAHRERVIAGTAPSVLWLLEHDPVITLGRRTDPNPPDPVALQRRGIDLYQTERGGLATYHGPGQLIGYLVCDIRELGLSVRQVVTLIEDSLITWLAGWHVSAGRREGAPGVWVGNDKIAALGLHFKRGVSMHGFALNLVMDLSPYEFIVPCGIVDAGTTTLHRLISGSAPLPAQASRTLGPLLTRMLLHPPTST